MATRDYEIGDAELDVLRVLWDEGPSTVREVMTPLHARGRRVAYTTVQTLLNRLELKGFVSSDKSDLAFVFRARLTRDRVRRSRVNSLVGKLYDGAAGPLVLHLIKTRRLSAEEITELQNLIERLDPETD